MEREVGRPAATAASVVFNLLDPLPYGFFMGALIFDAVYADNAEVLWFKAAAWLIAMGLLFAVVPRLINLVRVWRNRGRTRALAETAGFWLNLFAVLAAIVNAFVHSRDAYGVMPLGLWLSAATILLLGLAQVLPALRRPNAVASS